MSRSLTLHVLVLASAVLASAVLGGCALVNDPAQHLAPPVASQDFCEEVAVILCEAKANCCSEPFDEAVCLQQSGLFCTSLLSELINDPRTGYSPEQAAAQLSRGRHLGASCDAVSLAEWSTTSDGLISVLEGTVDPNASCQALRPEDLPRGILDWARFYSCRDEHACVPGDATLVEWFCRPRAGLGEPCIGPGACEPGLLCAAGGAGTICSRRLATGSPCTARGQCESYVCEAGVCADATVDNVVCNPASVSP